MSRSINTNGMINEGEKMNSKQISKMTTAEMLEAWKELGAQLVEIGCDNKTLQNWMQDNLA